MVTSVAYLLVCPCPCPCHRPCPCPCPRLCPCLVAVAVSISASVSVSVSGSLGLSVSLSLCLSVALSLCRFTRVQHNALECICVCWVRVLSVGDHASADMAITALNLGNKILQLSMHLASRRGYSGEPLMFM